MNNNFIKVILSIFLSINIASNVHATEPKNIHGIMVYEVESSFEFVRDDLVRAIKQRGMVISYIAHAKDMLDRTADAVNTKTPAYRTGAEIVLFCKSDISHKLTQANPHYIALCPYSISIYDIQDDNEKVFLSYRKPPADIKEYVAIENLLREIIEEVIEQ
ncbi:MAG: DUF302 domain-containing protein [Gammaproteobacteria bacterium]|nr:DUF302 domain-containing protein [Gammaproteobacteria bacterium]